MRFRILVTVSLLALTLWIYLPTARFGFVEFDDPYYVYDNPHLTSGLSLPDIRFAFTSYLGGNWNPLVWLSFESDQVLWHLNPHAMHMENFLLHGITTAILFLLLADATGSRWRSAAVAALFACHPMHVESVAWISERKDVLSTPLLFASIAFYVRYARPISRPSKLFYYLAAFACYALSLSAKSMGVTLPGILFLLDTWPLRRVSTKDWRIVEKVPFVLSAIGISVVTMLAQHAQGAIAFIPLSQRISNAVVCFIAYIGKLFWPTNLAVYYPLPISRPIEAVVAAGILIVIITAIVWRLRNRAPYLLIGWLWFAGTLIPVIGLVQVGGQAMADRYCYLPSVGLSIAVVWGGFGLISLVKNRLAQISIAGILAALAISILSHMARQQVYYWHDNDTLFARAMEVTDHNSVAAVMLGRGARQRGNLPAAYSWYLQAVQFDNTNAGAHDQLGLCLIGSAPNQAIGEFKSAVRCDPQSITYRLHLIDAFQRIGQIESAIDECRKVIKLDPQSAEAARELAVLRARTHT